MPTRARFISRAIPGAAAALVASCTGAQNTMAPAGPAAGQLAGLGWFVLGVFAVVSLVMWVLIFWLAARRRGTLATHLAWDAPEDRRWIFAGGLAIPAVVFATTFVLMLKTMSAFPMGDHEGMASDVRVVGYQWWWRIEYLDARADRQFVTANELHVPVGQPVDIELQSHDVIHSFWVPRLHGKVDLLPGHPTHIRIQADVPGLYTGQCAEYCGPQHAHMGLVVVAEPAADFAAWRDRQRAPAPAPATDQAADGRQVFMTHQCVMCHTIRGTPAQGLVGPDLTHIGSRAGLAANTLPNTTAALSAWVTHAQSLKPYAGMPSITAFTGDELQALVAYLQSLK
jgi:cytochrome c oxidase subunit 2